jgi:RNA polymerase sigma-70 factor (ECF subfamily)
MKISIPNQEEVLIRRCLNKDRISQKQLYDKYKDAMYTIAFRILRNEDLACDALQEGFVKVFTKLENFRFESTLGAWIKTIIVRSSTRILDKEIRKPEYEGNIIDEVFTWDDSLTGEVLDMAIANLSPGYRAVFLLIEVEGYSHKEVAEMLNISIGTSNSQLSSAKVILKHEISPSTN